MSLYFGINDTVEITFTYDSKQAPFNMVITSIIPRYGKCNGERSNLLIGKLVDPVLCDWPHKSDTPNCYNCRDTGIKTTQTCSDHYVTKIIAKGTPVNKTYNKYRDECLDPFNGKFQGKVISGLGAYLFCYALSKIDKNISRSLYFSKAIKLYYKNPLGLIRVEEEYNITVNRKKFIKWVSKNLDQILHTAKEEDKFEEAREDMYEEFNEITDTFDPGDVNEYDNTEY
jgi:hypothetical protein